ncbi:MAG TPA: hypothetical protein VGP07_23540 [Polyangia bacterium]|jgi:hypothetical protein
MKLRYQLTLLPALSLSIYASGCDQAGPPAAAEVDINVEPLTLDDAVASLTQIDNLQKLDAQDPRALAALQRLRPQLDALNHLVARVEPEPGHVVSFYEPQPGLIGVSETGPTSMAPRFVTSPALGNGSVLALFRDVSSGATPPAALVLAEARAASARAQNAVTSTSLATTPTATSSERPPAALAEPSGELTSTSSALTGADGPWWSANVCFKSGDFRGCFPNWSGGGFAQASAKTSFFQVAPFSGNNLSVRFQYDGSTRFTDALFPGQWGSWWWHSDSFASCWCSPICACGMFDYNRRVHRWDILNASGDGFHWTHAFKWSCGDTLSCDQSP